MLVPADLADAIKGSMFFPGATSGQLLQWATGIITEIQTKAKLNGPVPGPTSVISGMTGSSMANSVVTSGPFYVTATTMLTNFCQAICDHIQNDGKVSFQIGDISGVCIAPATPVINGAAANGKVVLLSGSALASLVASEVGYGSVSTPLLNFCTAVTDYIMANGVGSYTAGTVTGICPIISAGVGSNGKIS